MKKKVDWALVCALVFPVVMILGICIASQLCISIGFILGMVAIIIASLED